MAHHSETKSLSDTKPFVVDQLIDNSAHDDEDWTFFSNLYNTGFMESVSEWETQQKRIQRSHVPLSQTTQRQAVYPLVDSFISPLLSRATHSQPDVYVGQDGRLRIAFQNPMIQQVGSIVGRLFDHALNPNNNIDGYVSESQVQHIADTLFEKNDNTHSTHVNVSVDKVDQLIKSFKKIKRKKWETVFELAECESSTQGNNSKEKEVYEDYICPICCSNKFKTVRRLSCCKELVCETCLYNGFNNKMCCFFCKHEFNKDNVNEMS